MSRATQVRSTLAMPKNSRSSSVGSSTVLVNLDVYIIRATIGRDISPDDDDLIVLFRRNSKEVTSEPTRWHPDHIAEWNQHVGIQTSLLRNKQSQLPSDVVDYLPKDYEVVLVALPSHSAVALFSLDFAQIVQTQRANRPKPFRVSPSKCRDLAATLEFEVVWEFASPPPPLTPTHSPSLTTNVSTSSLSMAGRRTNVSVVSMSSQNSELTSNGAGGASKEDCSDCRSLRRRLERKELQILQLENFLKESQKRIDSLVFENEELVVREQAETTNAAQYRALNMRLLQELEMAFQFCAQQMIQAQQTQSGMPPQMFMFLPQFEFMERVKKFHADLELIYAGSAATLDLHDSSVSGAAGGGAGSKVPQTPMDAWSAFDFKEEMDVALERNQRLQRQLEFLARSLAFEDGGGGGEGGSGPPELRRKVTNRSSASEFSIASPTGGAHDDEELSSSRVAPVRSVTEQLNALERENFLLKAKLESAMNDLKSARHDGGGRGGSSPSECAETATTASSTSRQSNITATLSLLPVVPDDSPLRMEVDQLREEKLDLVQELENLRAELETVRMNPPPALPIGGIGAVATPSNSVHISHSGGGGGGGGLGNSRASMASVGSPTPPGGSDFLNKIYMDVGKAKVALEEKVKRLNQQLTSMQEENERLQTQIMITAGGGGGHGGDDSADWESQIEELKTTIASDRAAMEEERRQLEEQIHHLQQVIDEKTSQLKVQNQELQFMKQHLTEKAALVAELESAKTQIQTQLDSTTQMLNAAQKRVTALEIKLETLAHDQLQQTKDQELHVQQLQLQQQQQQQRAVATSTTKQQQQQSKRDDDELSDLTKQLKLARQEVMQLRYRSNNLESVHEKLEEALKEKKTLQVKLTALEGQLYEQRSRTTSGMNFASDGKDVALMEELQRMLDGKTAQLTATQREVDSLRRELESGAQASVAASSKSGADICQLEAKVAQFVAEIARLGERNDDQALRINALSERVEKTTREKYELEGIMKELLKEMDELAALSGAAPSPPSPARSHAASAFSTPNVSSHESEDGFVEEEEKEEEKEEEEEETLEDKHALLSPAPPSVVVRPTGNKVMERYANALKSTFERRGSAGRPPAPSPSHGSASPARVTTSKIAHLIKNFSSDEMTTSASSTTDDDDDDGVMANGRRRSTLGGSIKKVTRMDFANRQRQGSEPSSS